MNIKPYIIFLFAVMSLYSSAQEVVSGVQFNEAVVIESKKMAAQIRDCNCDKSVEETKVLLPFFDDFSTSNIFPDQKLWDGMSVFVNKDFAYMPVNIGAATLDAIDKTGSVYSGATWVPFKADELMTQDIRLDSVFSPVPRKLSPVDSVYLSFFYQPQGVGDSPQPNDTLVLEFATYSGAMIFLRIDSVTVNTKIYISEGETINPLDTLYAPAGMGCNPDVYTIVYSSYDYGDSVRIACDSVFEEEVLWNEVWYSEGQTLSDFYDTNGRYMMQVMIPVLDTNYFSDKFRFRFRNYCSVSNEYYPDTWKYNGDQWNVDYVYLNHSRSIADTTYRALTFSQRAPSFLNRYQVMPYRQYRYSPTYNTADTIHMFIANLDNIERNTSYEYSVQQVNGSFGYKYDGGNCNLKPFYEVGFQNCENCGSSHACPPVNSLFSLNYDIDTTSYIIKHYISDSSDVNSIVDSAIYRQGFYNYYAYDDGTPEKGWGYDGAGGAQIAYKFDLSTMDTLWGIQMYFNKTVNSANELYFDILLWNDNNGKPGEIIYRQESEKVQWENGLYSFTSYMLEEPQIVTGIIYVGMEQFESKSYNMGMDANNDVSDLIFYKADTAWKKATVAGALLMRPIIGANMILSTNPANDISNNLVIYPNPAQTQFYVKTNALIKNNNAELVVYNMIGNQILYTTNLSNPIDISGLAQGIYIVRVVSNNQIYSAKLLINR